MQRPLMVLITAGLLASFLLPGHTVQAGFNVGAGTGWQQTGPAQEPEEEEARPAVNPIVPGQVVEETITDFAVFDWWQLQLDRGDLLIVEMQGYEGLAPLVGLLSPDRELIARSDEARPPEPDGLSVLQYTVETPGLYTIVATRGGNEQGTSTGPYRLVARLDQTPRRENPFQEVAFRCQEMIVTAASTIEFAEDIILPEDPPPGYVTEFYQLTVYALDDFHPVIRADSSRQGERLDCTDDAQRMPGTSFRLPGFDPIDVTEADLDRAAQLSLRSTSPVERFGEVTFTIGSLDGAPGRYIAVLSGLRIEPFGDQDEVRVRLAPLSQDTTMQIYMIGLPENRLDPFLILLDEERYEIAVCDDAARRGCEETPRLDTTAITFPETELIVCQSVDQPGCEDSEPGETVFIDRERAVRGDRFDAGVTLAPGSSEQHTLWLQARSGSTTGDYLLVFIGELPPSSQPPEVEPEATPPVE